MTAFGCNTLMVNYTVNPLPGGGNEATLSSLGVSYRPILGSGSSGTRSVALNGNAIEGVLCLSGLPTNTAYRVTYSVEVNTGLSTGLPSDLSAPEELLTGRTCSQLQCPETNRTRVNTGVIEPSITTGSCQPSTTSSAVQPSTTSTSMGYFPTPSATNDLGEYKNN